MAGERGSLDGLIRSLAKRSSHLISRLESGVHPLSPDECYELFSSVGYLRHGAWLASTNRADQELGAPYGQLKDQLARILRARGDNLVSCLETGILACLQKIEGAVERIRPYLQKKELGSTYTSHEFNGELLDVRDELGYTQILLEEIGQPLSDSAAQQVRNTDNRLREFLNDALVQFRALDDDPTTEPEIFPPSFWWRRREAS